MNAYAAVELKERKKRRLINFLDCDGEGDRLVK